MNNLDQLNALTMQQLRALVSQNKIKLSEGPKVSRALMLRALVKFSETQNVDLLEGVRG